VFSDGPISGSDVLPLAPFPVCVAVEDFVSICDEILGCFAGLADGSAEERPDFE